MWNYHDNYISILGTHAVETLMSIATEEESWNASGPGEHICEVWIQGIYMVLKLRLHVNSKLYNHFYN